MKSPVDYSEPRTPSKMEKHSAEFQYPDTKTSPLKGCVHFIVKPLFSCKDNVTTPLPLNENTRRVHNKENTKKHDRAQDEVSLNRDSLEESGYQSLQNSHIEKHEVDLDSEDEGLALDEQLLAKPDKQRSYTVSTPSAGYRSDFSLPLLRFEQAVCQELAEKFKRTRSYDFTVISKLAEDHSLDRVIGRRMGRESVDLFTALLERKMKHILTRILALLGEVDLINCRKVSRTWRRIINEDSSALHRCKQAEQKLWESTFQKENIGLTRNAALARVVLSSMQTVASCPIQRTKRTPQRGCHTMPSNAQPVRFHQFQEVASSLKQHEALKQCKRCGSPAKYDAHALRATCTRLSCAFDFCTRCQSPFHGSSSCRTLQARVPSHANETPILIGSARSKRMVRRL